MRVATIIAAAAILVTAAAHGQTLHKPDAYQRCVEDSVLWTLRRANGPIDKNKVASEVLSECFWKAPDIALTGPERDVWMTQAKRDIVKLAEKLAPRARVEKVEEDRTAANYYSCLSRHAKLLALATNEAADLVAQASLSACPAERAAVFDIRKRYGDDWTEGTMKAMESVLVQRLLLEIVAVRAQRSLTPVPPPTPSVPDAPKTRI